jgi:hypothetical protein
MWLQSQARNYTGLTLGIPVRSNGLLGGGFLSGFPGLKFCQNQNLTKSEAIVSLVYGLELKSVNPDSLKVYSDRSLISTPLAEEL